jgi:nickel-dependent lactate racemase
MESRFVSLELPYGKEHLAFELPQENLLAVAEPASVEPASDPRAEVLNALRHPVGARPLRDLVKPGQKVLIIVDDATRPTPQSEILPPLLEEIEGTSRQVDVQILIATGTHRAMTRLEICQKVGEAVAERYPVVNHDWAAEDQLVDLGTSANGTPIKVNRLVAQSDLVIASGGTVPHCLAGWAGGAKIIQPGVCGQATTNMTHALNMVSPIPHLGRLDNPMRQEIEAVVTRVPLHFMINSVLDRHGRIVHVVAGEPTLSHRKSVELAKAIWMVPVPALADIVLVSSHPADIDYWQGIKGLFAAELIVKRGGDIILATPCPEGIAGTAEHAETMTALAGVPSKEMRHVAEQRGLSDLAGVNTAVVAARVNELAWVSVYSHGLSDRDLRVLGHTRVQSIQEGLERAFKRQGAKAQVLVITHGGELCPVLAGANG